MARLSAEEKLRRKRLREQATRRRHMKKAQKKSIDEDKARRKRVQSGRVGRLKKQPGQIGWYVSYKGKYSFGTRQRARDPRNRMGTFQPVFKGKRNPHARVIPKGSKRRDAGGLKTKHNRYLKPAQWNRYGVVNPKLPSRYEKQLHKRVDRRTAHRREHDFQDNEAWIRQKARKKEEFQKLLADGLKGKAHNRCHFLRSELMQMPDKVKDLYRKKCGWKKKKKKPKHSVF